jgi:hypothetical protein
MSTFSQFSIGAKPPTDINARNVVSSSLNLATTAIGVNQQDCGALTADTLSTIIDVTGSGIAKVLTVYTADTTSRTLRVRITIDSVVIYDQTTSAITAAGTGLNPIGILRWMGASAYLAFFEELIFNNNYKVEVASSLTETDNFHFIDYHQLTS